MSDLPVQVLLMEDNPGDARLIQALLAEAGAGAFRLEYADRLAAGLERLAAETNDVVLLDLSLPDSQGLDTFLRVRTQAPDLPIVILTGLADETLAIAAVREGAQDYLVKSQVNSPLLVRAIRYAVERQRLRAVLLTQSLMDELTGLHNRRGFLTMAEQYWKLARRTRNDFLLVFADLDGLKQINDAFGHQEGDVALRQTAEILRQTFRASDILARLGGDEFTVLVLDAAEGEAEKIMGRLQENLEAYNAQAQRQRGYRLAVSIGIVRFDPARAPSIEELMARADRVLYEHKHGQRKTPVTGELPPRGGDAGAERGTQ